MTPHGALTAISLPILGTLGKGRRAALSASRLSASQVPHAVPSIAPVPALAGLAGVPHQQA